MGSVCCGSAGCLRAFFGREVGSRLEGKFGRLTHAPALLVGKLPGGHPGSSEKLDSPFVGTGHLVWTASFHCSEWPGSDNQVFHGAWPVAPRVAQMCSSMPDRPPPLGLIFYPHPLRKWGGRNRGFAVSYPGGIFVPLSLV